VQDHEEFDNFWGGGSRIVDRYYSPSALANKGQPCAAWHATHVAALAAGLSFGAAKDAQIISGAQHTAGRRWLFEQPARMAMQAR